jgi:hypothetical protein
LVEPVIAERVLVCIIPCIRVLRVPNEGVPSVVER